VLALGTAGIALAGTSPAQYRAQATTICKGTSAKLAKVKSPQVPKDVNPFLKAAVPIFQEQHDKLGKLTPPKIYKFLHKKVLTLEQEQIDGLKDVISKVDKGGDPKKTFTAAEGKLGPIADAETAAWKKLRVPACANL